MRVKTITRVLALVGFVALAVGSKQNPSVKQRLAERSNNEAPSMLIAEAQNGLAVPEPTLLAQATAECPCDCCECSPCDIDVCGFSSHLEPHACDCGQPHVPLECYPLGDSGPITSSEIEFEASQSLNIQTVPTVREITKEESKCCSAEEETHEALEKSCKYRHFCIKGDICVSEKVTFQENGIEINEAEGHAHKTTVEIEKTEAGLGGPELCYNLHAQSPLEIEVDVCLPTEFCDATHPCDEGYHCVDGHCVIDQGEEPGCSVENAACTNPENEPGHCHRGYCVMDGPCDNTNQCGYPSVLFCKKPIIGPN